MLMSTEIILFTGKRYVTFPVVPLGTSPVLTRAQTISSPYPLVSLGETTSARLRLLPCGIVVEDFPVRDFPAGCQFTNI